MTTITIITFYTALIVYMLAVFARRGTFARWALTVAATGLLSWAAIFWLIGRWV